MERLEDFFFNFTILTNYNTVGELLSYSTTQNGHKRV